MKTIVTLLGLTLMGTALAQTTSFYSLGHNNVDANVTDGGIFFQRLGTYTPGYEVPKGGGANAIFSMSFWFGGIDENSQLKMAAQTYLPFKDFYLGPLTLGDANPPAPGTWNVPLLVVTKGEIDAHIINNQNPQPGYVVPQSFTAWPAHGDVAQGFAHNLAPFVDVDQDGIYDPSAGDYPCIRGDQAVYLIMNDKGGPHQETGGDPIGMEMHFMVYQYATSDYLNDQTFVHTKLINRGTQTLYDFRMASFLDSDLGGPVDDYVGCDSTRNMVFTYNADDMDADHFSSIGYGEYPPAIGVVSLNQNMSAAAYFSNGALYPYGAPQNASGYYNYMNGKWANGDAWVHGGLGYVGSSGATTTPTKFMFPGNPVTGQGWSEASNSNPPGDRRMLLVNGLGIFAPEDEIESDYAFIYARSMDSDPFASVEELYSMADDVQSFYDNQMNTCEGFLSVNGIEAIDFALYPNPSSGTFVLELGDFSGKSFKITDITGREVMSETPIVQSHTTIKIEEQAGIYLIHCTDGSHTSVRRMMVK